MNSKIIIATVLLFETMSLFADDTALLRYEGEKPRNVILFIGDGMSVPQREATEEFSKAVRGVGLFINSMPYSAATTTRSANNAITDSAASGTAIACGKKTNNGRIGMDADGNSLESSAELAKKAGKKVGIVTSVTINHATPAAFYGHNGVRSDFYGLGLDLVASGFDYFGGGGVADNDRKNHPKYNGDIYELVANAGYKVVRKDKAAFSALTPADGKVLTTGANGALEGALDQKPDDISLAEFTAKAIEMLDNPNGFFLMVEGGRVDWAGHANDAGLLFAEIIELDKAVKVALDYAAEHSDTLVVATGDHETGGLSIGLAGTGDTLNYQVFTNQTVSLSALGEKIDKIIKNDKEAPVESIYLVLRECLGLRADGDSSDVMTLTDAEKQKLAESFERQKMKKRGMSVATQAGHIFASRSGLSFNSFGHTALSVRTSAIGMGASAFTNAVDNTMVSLIIKDLLTK